MAAKAGREKAYKSHPISEELLRLATDKCGERLRQAKQIGAKVERALALRLAPALGAVVGRS